MAGAFGGMIDAKGPSDRKPWPVGDFLCEFLMAARFKSKNESLNKLPTWFVLELRIIDSADGQFKGTETAYVIDLDDKYALSKIREVVQAMFSEEEITAWANYARENRFSETYEGDDLATVAALMIDPAGQSALREAGQRVIARAAYLPSKSSGTGVSKKPIPKWKPATDATWELLTGRKLPAASSAAAPTPEAA